ncbi:MAG TPA: TonB-dependent receptor [Candidatus Dormibacteraeota bacterium]|nr:TonB-dependent receptor [Candidatus Dormibacteraeota bacterium]
MSSRVLFVLALGFRMPKALLRACLVGCGSLLLSLLLCVAGYAQYRAGIQGVVTDISGALVPDAAVTLTSNETNISRTTKTSESGVFTLSGLAPGAYSVVVEKPGFTKKILNDVRVDAEQMRSLNVQLEVGLVTESVTVSESSVALLDTQAAAIGGTFTSRDVENLPSMGRDPFQLIRLTPGVFGDGAQTRDGGTTTMPGSNRPSAGPANSIFFIENGPQITANGTRPNSNLIQVDGVGVNSVSWGGSAVLTPNEESIKEVRVIASNYSAENGRNSGAQIMIISKNGTNQLHGSAFFKWHRPGLNAYQRWNGPGNPSPVRRDDNRFNQEGGGIGGPILKNKLFAFFSYETLRNSAIGSTITWFETPQFLQSAGPAGSIARKMLSFPGQAPLTAGLTSQTCAQVGLPATQCRDVPGGLDLGSPLTTALGTTDPTFGKPGTPFGIGKGFDGIPDAMRVVTATPRSSTNAQYNGRLDYQATQGDLIAFSIYRVPTHSLSINGRARELSRWTSDRLSQSFTGIWNHTFSGTMLNEARFGASGWNFNELESNSRPWGLPTSTIDSYGNVAFPGWGLAGPGVFDQGTWSARDMLNKIRGSHSLKFGGEFSRSKYLDDSAGSARPTYNFRNLWSYANDAPYQESGNFDPLTGKPSDNRKDLRFNIIAFYVQDDWKVKPNLTVNLGLRWEYYSPLSELHGLISNPVLGAGPAALTGLTIRKGGDLTATSKRNFGPQVGFNWSPGSLLGHDFQNKLVLRGGFGIGYNTQQLATLSNGRSNPPFTQSLTLNSTNCCILYSVPSDINSFTGYPSNPDTINTFDPDTGLPNKSIGGAKVNLQGFPSYQKTPVTYRYSLDVQYDLGHSWVATIGYQGSQSRNYSLQLPLNLIYYANRNPKVNSLAWFTNDGAAHYNALLTEIQHRFSNTFTIDFQYRLSRTTDQGSQDYYTDLYPFDLNTWNGPSDNDVTHNYKLWGVWSPTIFKGSHSWLEMVAGGWTLSGILNTHSGFPWTPTYNTRVDLVYPNSGYRNLRPGQYLGGAGSEYSNATFQRPNGNFPNGALAYFTLPAFSTTAIPPAAGVGRNSFRGPRYFGLDMTLAKAFGLPNMKILGEHAKLNLQVNAYNVFNKLNLNPTPTTSISNDGVTSNPQFGQVQGAFAGRIVELQARFSF